MKMQNKIENLFSTIFSESVLKGIEKYILYLASIGFVIHLSLIFLNNNNLIDLAFINFELSFSRIQMRKGGLCTESVRTI